MLWDLKDARRFGVTPQHKGPVWSLAYSRGDGSILASGTPCCHVCLALQCEPCYFDEPLLFRSASAAPAHSNCASNCSLRKASLL